MVEEMRQFETGATRDTSEGKPDYAGCLSPLALEIYAAYMLKHQRQPDGKLRSSSNWKKGIPREEYLKSAFRHLHEWWKLHELGVPDERQIEDAVCGVLFNAFGYLHEGRVNRPE